MLMEQVLGHTQTTRDDGLWVPGISTQGTGVAMMQEADGAATDCLPTGIQRRRNRREPCSKSTTSAHLLEFLNIARRQVRVELEAVDLIRQQDSTLDTALDACDSGDAQQHRRSEGRDSHARSPRRGPLRPRTPSTSTAQPNTEPRGQRVVSAWYAAPVSRSTAARGWCGGCRCIT